jgi:hypothetical protein
MTSLLRRLFDDEPLPEPEAATDEVTALRAELTSCRRRIDRLELLCEALVSVLDLRGHLEGDELALAVRRIDLSDGIEDGKIGPDAALAAPCCRSCGRPINPERQECVYCFASIRPTGERGGPYRGGGTGGSGDEPLCRPRPIRTCACALCGTTCSEDEIYLSRSGQVCEQCFLEVAGRY